MWTYWCYCTGVFLLLLFLCDLAPSFLCDDQHDFKNVVPLVIVISILLKIRCVRLLETKEEYLGNRRKRLQGKVRHYVNKYPVVLPVHLIVVELQKILCCCCCFVSYMNKYMTSNSKKSKSHSVSLDLWLLQCKCSRNRMLDFQKIVGPVASADVCTDTDIHTDISLNAVT